MKQITIIFLSTLLLVACKPSDEQMATQIINSAKILVDSGQWRQARILLDSLHTTYPKQIEQRRVADAIDDSITVMEAHATLAYVDTLLPPLLEKADQLIKRFKYQKNEQYEDHGKYVHRLLATASNTSRNFLQAYVTDDRKTVVKSYYYGSYQVNQQSVTLKANAEESMFRGRNHHFQDGAHHEIMSLDEDNALALLNFISTHQNARVRIEGMGDKPTRNWVYYLNDKEKEALSDTYQLGWLMKDINRLEQMQRTANAQINYYSQKQ